MATDCTDHNLTDGIAIRRRTLLGVALAAGVLGPMISTGTARADSATHGAADGGTDDEPEDEEYPIPDETGSEAWW